MSTRRRLLSSLSILVIFTLLFSGLSLPPASAQGPDGIKRQVNAQTGKVSFIGAENGSVLSADKVLGLSAGSRPQDPAMALAKRFGPEFGLQNPERELSQIKSSRAENGRITARYQQNYQGIPVMGGELIVNTNENGDLYSINGEVSPTLALSTQPAFTAEQAQQTALQAVAKWYQKSSVDFTTSEPALWIYDESLLRASTRPAELVWRLEVTPHDAAMPVRELVLVNAQRGGISLHFNQVDMAWQSPVKQELSQQNTPTDAPSVVPSIVKYEDLVVDEARSKIYGADKVGNKIDVIDMTTLSLTSSYLLVYGSAPISIDLSPNGNELAVAQSGSGLLAFINLTNGAISQSSSALTGSGSYATDVIYGRAGVLYALSNNGIHTIDLTVTPHAEVVSKYVTAESSYDQKFGALASSKNTLYFVTGTCCSGYNSLNKYDVSSGLAQPTLVKQTHIFGTGYMHDLRLSLLNDQSLLVTSGIVYNTANLTPKARNLQWARPALNLPGRSFYVTLNDNEGTQVDALNFYDKETSYQVSTLSTGVIGTAGAIAATSNGNTIFVSSTGGMAKFTVGNTPPGTPVSLPSSQHRYSDLAIDLPRNLVYGTDVSGRIDVINMSTEAVVNSYLLPSGAEPKGIDLSPNGSELAIALNGLEKLVFLDPATGSLIAELTPQLDDSIYYQNDPFDLIYGKPGRLYASGNPSSSGIDYIHVIDTVTHTWVTKSPYPIVIRTDTEFVLNQSKTRLYANQTFSPNNIYIYDVQTDLISELYRGPHGPVYAQHFTIVPDGSKIFTSNGQVWDSILQTQLGSLEGAPGTLIKYVPNKNVIVLSAAGAGGDVLKFIDPGNYRLLGTYTPSPAGTIHEMEVAPDGSRLIINIGNQVKVLNLNLSQPSSLAVVSGSNQSTAPQTQFPLPLKVRVGNYLGLPISGVTVTFTAPASGASGKFANTNTNVSTAVSDANGIASSAAFSANNVAGGYTVQATAAGVAGSADFSLFNGTQRVKTYTANNGTTLPGTLLCDQSNVNCTNGANPHADAAHKYAVGTHLLYATQHGRNSIDNNNMIVISTVHYDVGYDNAFWNGSQMVYGDAYGYPLADDVVAHELTHGVTQYESNLFYYYQSGAINESLSDLWGEYYDQSNGQGNDAANFRWLMGEDVAGQGALRSMSNPSWYGDPDSITSFYYYTGEEDSGGVHTNSGVNNKAVFLMVDGGDFNGKTVTSLGWTKTAAIYYEANTNLLTSGADYSDLYYALQTACSNLIGQKGITATDCTEVKDAIDAVVMNGQPVSNFNTEAPVCTAGGIPNFVFTDDLEAGTANWTFSNGAFPRWQLDAVYGPYARSGLHSLFADDYPDQVTDAIARLKPLVVPNGAYLHFAHAYGFESGYNTGDPTFYDFDGGVLEYSINNGGTWADAGSLMDYNGYDGVLFTGAGNPLSGRSAFAGDSHGYISTRLNLSSLAGKTVIFRWRMGLDEAGYDWGWWVDNVRLYTCKVLPGAFNKTSPANGAVNQTLSPTLRWGISNAATSYEYCYDTTNDNTCSTWVSNGNATSKALTGLNPGTTYYWHVRAINSSGTTYANGSATAFWSFSTIALPGAFSKTSPSNGSTGIALSTTLSWGSSSSASSYHYCYDLTDDDQCNRTWVTTASPSADISNLGTNSTYYWQVRALNAAGITEADNSNWGSFTTTPTLPANFTTIESFVGGNRQGKYSMEHGQSLRESYTGLNNGPVRMTSTNLPLIGAERVIYKINGTNTSFTEMMGLPASQLDTIYWLPWYNNINLDTQLRFANVSNTTATVHVYIGGQEMGTGFTLAAGQSTRQSFPGIDNGPVKIVSNQPIVAAERVIYRVNNINTSFSEMMALPNSQLDTAYWLPWYNNINLDSQLRIANVTDQPATVTITIGGVAQTPINLAAGESTRVSYTGVNNGPVKIVSTQNIVAAERVIYKINNVYTSFTEMMGLPANQLDTAYWLPWYNNTDLDTQLRFANVTDSPASVHVYIGGIEMDGSPFALGANASTRISFAGVNSGPVQIVSDQPIVAAERVIYKVNNINTSFSEMMGLPDALLDTTYWLPWYNNASASGLDTQLRFGVP